MQPGSFTTIHTKAQLLLKPSFIKFRNKSFLFSTLKTSIILFTTERLKGGVEVLRTALNANEEQLRKRKLEHRCNKGYFGRSVQTRLFADYGYSLLTVMLICNCCTDPGKEKRHEGLRTDVANEKRLVIPGHDPCDLCHCSSTIPLKGICKRCCQ